MEETENIFFAESGDIDSSLLKDKLKIGEIFRHKDGTTSLNCIRCSREFDFFTEFTLHIQEHYLRNDIFPQVENIKCEDETDFIDNNPMSITEISVKCEKLIDIQPEDINDGYYSDNENFETSFNDSCSNELREDQPLSEGNLIYEKQNYSRKGVKDVNSENSNHYNEPMQDDHENKIVIEGVEQTHLEYSNQLENEPIPNKRRQLNVHKQRISQESMKKVQTAKTHMKSTFVAKVATGNPSKILKCLFCTKRFAMARHVRTHIQLKHNKKLGLEEIVTAQQNPKLKLKDFVEDKNKYKKANKNFECFLCHHLTNTMIGLKRHMNVHADKKFGCPLCSRPFSRSNFVRNHLIFKHSLSKGEITSEMITKNIADLPKPKLPKKEVRDYECILCKRHYKSWDCLKQHLFHHEYSSRECSILCTICGTVFRRSETFRSHMEVHAAGTSRDIKCDLCGKMFQTRRYMLIHKHRMHSKKKLIKKEPEPKNKCKECGEVFPSRYKLKLHVELHTTTVPIESKCEICDMTFTRPNGLKDHMIVHTHNNVTTCNICGKEVSTRYLQRHLKIHMGNKEFKCNKCDMAFMDRTSLRNHMVRHEEGEMKFKCSKCSRAFRRAHKLLLHSRALHPELLQFSCGKCDKGFLTFASLKKHENEHFRKENVELQSVKPN